ncbi:MAG: hypothetical protein M5U16_11160 [Hyphomicrobium sp.]|nr:hypothetical protein [Hyphomicrobium sp.]MCZ7595393.1 hypothetical protein [Hyphomicrobium sp.]
MNIQKTGAVYSTMAVKPSRVVAPKATRLSAMAACSTMAVEGAPLPAFLSPSRPNSG